MKLENTGTSLIVFELNVRLDLFDHADITCFISCSFDVLNSVGKSCSKSAEQTLELYSGLVQL